MTAIPSHVPSATRTSPRYDMRSDVGATGHVFFVCACVVVGTALTMGVLAVSELRGSGSQFARHLEQAAVIAQMDPPRLPFVQASSTSATAQR